MKYKKLRYILITVIIVSFLSVVLAFAEAPNKAASTALALNNIALCYHGIVANASEKYEYMSYIEDFKDQINHLKSKGYTFVMPSKFNEWYTNKYVPTTPIATIIFDDARASVDIAAQWLIDNKIPFGVAVIGEKLGAIEPEEGYMSWATLKTLFDTGFCEISSHSYNMHHYDLGNENGTVVSQPILEGPCYVDAGEFVYMDKGDTRWYWDLSYVDEATWAFPLFGTDLATGNLITSSIKFKSKDSVTANKMRVWAALHLPNSSGYDVNVKIDINGTEVANKAINVQQYETRSQWPEREFVTIDFDKSYVIEPNKSYTITFTTQNTGNSAFRIYSIPDFSGDYELSTTSTGMTYGAQEKWPAKACVILAGENGRLATETEFEQYAYNDLSMNNSVVRKYLSASWESNTTGFTENESLECVALGGTYSDGSLADTNIKYTPGKSFTGEVLRLKSASHLGEWYPLITDVFINDKKVARFSADWKDWSWQSIHITPFEFIQGEEYTITFKTLNKSPSGLGVVRILADQQDLPWPRWNQETDSWIPPADSEFQYKAQYQVSSLEGSDVYPTGIDIQNQDYTWQYTAPYAGPGKPFLEILSCTPGPNIVPTQICYPFGSYYSNGTSTTEDVGPIIKNILNQINIQSGFAVFDETISSMVNIQSKYSEFVIPRYLVKGNLDEIQIIKNIDILIGIQ